MSISIEDLAYAIVDDYLGDGPEYLSIVEAAQDNGYEEETEWEELESEVNALLNKARAAI